MRPTIEEFKDFATYVAQIEPEIRAFGGCQIIPPPEWAHHRSAPDGTSLIDRVEHCLQKAPDTRITPLRQHIAGREGRFQAVMELLDSTPLSSFIKKSDEHFPASIAALDPAERDARFWRGVAGGTPAEYGADSSEVGSLFDPSLAEWNLGALPGGAEHDLTQELPVAIPGLNRSMLYFGRWRSVFAMHTEDCELQGASYLHRGQPKRWYLVPPAYAKRVRALVAAIFPEQAQSCADFLRHKTTLLAPSIFKAANIPIHEVLQTEGSFVLVLSSTFHFGFNHVSQALNTRHAGPVPIRYRYLPVWRDRTHVS